jgi:hypothetical protein
VIGSYNGAGLTPFVYTEKDGRQRLAGLIVNPDGLTSIESARHINDRGQIAGIADTSLGRQVFVATPVPEPSSLMVAMVCCICAKAFLHRRSIIQKA